MNTSLVVFTVIAMCGLVRGFNFPKNTCRRPFGMMSFDIDKFVGEWYVAGHIMSDLIPKMKMTCQKGDYSYKTVGNTTRINVNFSMKINDKQIKIESVAQPIFPDHNSVVQGATKKIDDDKWMGMLSQGVFMQSVMATDYENFAVTYACHPVYVDKVDMFDKIEVIDILSRKPKLDDDLFKLLTHVLGSFGFDVSNMEKIDNKDC